LLLDFTRGEFQQHPCKQLPGQQRRGLEADWYLNLCN